MLHTILVIQNPEIVFFPPPLVLEFWFWGFYICLEGVCLFFNGYGIRSSKRILLYHFSKLNGSITKFEM